MQLFGGPPQAPPDPDAKRTLTFDILHVSIANGPAEIKVPHDTKILNAEIADARHMNVGVVRVGLTEEEQAQADQQAQAFEEFVAQQAAAEVAGEAGDDQSSEAFLRALDAAAEADAAEQAARDEEEDEDD